MVASWRSLIKRRERESLVMLIQKIRFTKSFTNIKTATRRMLNSSIRYMDLKKKMQEEHFRIGTLLPANAELVLVVETGMKKGYAYGFGSVELVYMRVEVEIFT
ncbi:hypothetical protein M9H77_06116 [Catharanthus roseus]|uniref:Uncharacterized protein n=1 Tax=Catharanthus roseus TaxID=4058 RepID=A0ACC0BR61_CATRO|nr:hypothetical protein M9H77_06116 [Catharanthus roseus]